MGGQLKFGENKMNNKAFTLIELLVVVLIIGILAAIAVPQYEKAVAKSRFTQLLIVSKALYDAQQRHIMAKGTKTTNLKDLDITIEGGTYGTWLETNDKITFDWGKCGLTGDSIRRAITCNLTSPQISYARNITTKEMWCCSTDKTGQALCQEAIPNALGSIDDASYCGAGGKTYYIY